MMFERESRLLHVATVGMLLLPVGRVLSEEKAPAPSVHPVPAAVADREPASFEAAAFGFAFRDEEARAAGVEWAEPRKIRQVVAEFAEGEECPEKLHLQYWHRTWDGKPDPILSEAGAGSVGWAAMDDWTNGQWKEASAPVTTWNNVATFVFSPTGETEFKDLGQEGVRYRRTLKIRVAAGEPGSAPRRIRAFTDAVLRPLAVRIQWGKPAEPAFAVEQGGDSGRLEVFNGSVVAVRPLGSSGVEVAPDGTWSARRAANFGVLAELLMAVDPADPRYDRTIVTVRSKLRPFSFAADEVARGDRILVDDLGVLLTRADDSISLDEYRERRLEHAGKTVYRRVLDEPEQTLSRAWNDMPLKRPLYFVHGLPGNRNAFRQDPNGDVGVTSNPHWFRRQKSPKDSHRKLWDGGMLELGFGLPPPSSRGGRELEEGFLPLLKTWWQAGSLHYEERAILDKLDGSLGDIQGDDPTVLLMKVRIVNTSDRDAATATLSLTSRAGRSEKLRVDGNLAWAQSGAERRLRYIVAFDGRGALQDDGDGVRWSLELAPLEGHNVYFAIPSITLASEAEIAPHLKRNFDADSRRICDFWREITARGAQITTPEPWLDSFHRSHLRHLLVNCVREIGSDRLHAHVGTFHYGVFPDESAMMVSDLDRRGYHEEAARCLESFLHYQGTQRMPGNFSSTDGLFYGSGGHDMGGYNKSHGWVLWLMAEHWKLARDREWMERAASKLVKACDWVVRERRATMRESEGGSRSLEYGFLPAGSLEDVTDYWHWIVTNACTVWGLNALSGALADYGHPEAERLVGEAKAYAQDFLRGVTESRVRAPVVRLRDGTYVPKYPSRLEERGRSHGWLRETLEGSIHLTITDLVDPGSPEARWILSDFEDNLYISRDYGYAIPVFDQFWFSRGGFSMQANLLGGPLPYLYRDEIQHFLRAYFNAFASAFYPEVRMLNEHSLPELGYPAGDHFKSSDEAQSTYWLRLMFIHERGGDLYLGQAIPRYWLEEGRDGPRTIGIERAATYFGPMSVQFASRASKGEIAATLTPPGRNPPGKVYLRFRHPKRSPIRSVTVNGRDHKDFDPGKEWVVLPGRVEGVQEVVARY